MPSYRIYTGAPSFSALKALSQRTYKWNSASCSATGQMDDYIMKHSDSQHEPSWIIPAATLDMATERISEMYKNVIFSNEDEDEDDKNANELQWPEGISEEEETVWMGTKLQDEGSLISWPPTNQGRIQSGVIFNSMDLSRVHSEIEGNSASVSFAYTSTSSIAVFPTFTINLHTLSTLSSLTFQSVHQSTYRKVNLLAVVLEIDGPANVTIKKGKEAGKEVTVLKLTVSDERGTVCRITAWRDVAEQWSGQNVSIKDRNGNDTDTQVDAVKRGDIVYLTNISVSTAPTVTDKETFKRPKISFNASSNLNSNMNICYRTLPSVPADKQFRPDLRLATSDPGLRRVSDIVKWFSDAVGLASD